MMDILREIMISVLIAVIPIFAGFLCDAIHKLAVKASVSAESERKKYLINEIDHAVQTAVMYVNQTFVDALKEAETWNSDDAKEAFNLAFRTVIETISDDAQDFIIETCGDIQKYLEVKIEEEVKLNKSRF